jgi:uncharacterized protein YbjT (DUF2867 family)
MIPDGFTIVAGSLGDQGGAAARTLKLHGRHVRALSRDRRSAAAVRLLEAGVEVVTDDLQSPEVVVRDLAGAAHVFAALTPFDEGGPPAQLRQVRNLAWAAVRAGAEHFISSSVGDPEHDQGLPAGSPWGAEQLLLQFDLRVTLLRPAFFLENLQGHALRRGPGGLVLRTPLPEKTVAQWIALDDVGALVRTVFDRRNALGSGPVPLAADELSFVEVRALLSEALGERVRYEQIAFGEVKDRHTRGMYRWFQSSAREEPDVAKLRQLHPGLQTMQQWLENGGLELDRLGRGSAPAAAAA